MTSSHQRLTAARRSDSFRPDVQGLRGLAVIAVVLYHAGTFVRGGFVGVDVFFVVSGFVIGLSLLAEEDRSGAVSIPRFVGRRVRRLLPALATMLVGALVVSVFVLSPAGPARAAGETARAAAVSLANFQLYGAVDYFGPDSDLNPFLHTWSLSVEEQFYAFFAVLVAGGAMVRWRLRHPGFAAVLVILGAVSFVLNVRWSSGTDAAELSDPQSFAFFAPFGRAWEFIVGVLLAIAATRLVRMHVALGTALVTCGLFMIGYAVLTFDDATQFPGIAVLIPVIGTLLVIAGGATSGPASGVLTVGWLRSVGDVSYSWYLWHWPFLVWARTLWPDTAITVALAIGVSYVVGVLSYRLLERPIRLSSSLQDRSSVRVAGFCVVAPLLASTVFLGVVDTGLGLRAVDDFAQRTQARDRGCHGDLDDPILPLEVCTWRVAEPSGTILLVGDSHAVSIADAIVSVGNAQAHDVSVQTRSLCPFQSRRVKRRGCANYQRSTIELIQEIRPDVLVIANRAPAYVTDTPLRVVDADDNLPVTAADRLAAWDAGLDGAIADVESSVGRIVIFETVPEFESIAPNATVSLIRPDGLPDALTLSDVDARRGPTAEIHEAIRSRHDSVEIVDPVPVLCEELCRQERDGRWLFYDDDHLTVYGASLLEPQFEEVLGGT